MSSLLKLWNGDQLYAEEEAQALADRFDASRRDGTLTKVDVSYGPVWVNPHVVATITPHDTSGPPLIA